MAPSALEVAEKDRQAKATQLKFLLSEVTNDIATPLDESDVNYFLEKSTVLYNELLETHRKIIGHLKPDSDQRSYDNEHHELLSQTSKLCRDLCRMKNGFSKASLADTTNSPASDGSTKKEGEVRLPRVELPKFSGKVTDWISFRDLFVTSVHNNKGLSNSQKFTYLQLSVVGDAAKVIKSISITEDNYPIAWDLLLNRYQNERELFFSILRKFVAHPCVSTDSASGLRGLVDATNECTRTLETLEVRVNQWDGILCYHIVEKLDSSSLQFWELSLKDTKIPTLTSLLQFIEQRARSLAASGSTKSHTNKLEDKLQRRVHAHHVVSQGQGQKGNLKCSFCADSHYNFKCPKFNAMTDAERQECVRKEKVCFNCLREGHSSKDCRSERGCQTCKRRHHTLLHLDSINNIRAHHVMSTDNPPGSPLKTSNITFNPADVILITALVKVNKSDGSEVILRALLDSGSNSSFITEDSAKKLGIKKTELNTQVVGIGSSPLGRTSGLIDLSLTPYFTSETKGSPLSVTVCVVRRLTGQLPLATISLTQHNHLKKLTLADPTFHLPGEIHVLLGGEVFWEIVRSGRKYGRKGSLVAIESKFGWLVAGRSTVSNLNSSIIVNHASLDHVIRSFWEVEAVPEASTLTEEEKSAEEHFKSNYSRDQSGRYKVKLPFKSSASALGTSREIAVRRLLQLERRLKCQPKCNGMYIDFMRSYKSLGHMQPINESDVSNSPHCYIPHHFVMKDLTTPEKFRVVFDASAKTSSGTTLNEMLMVGPTIQPTLVTLLMRFRRHRVGVTADIGKMYRQILVDPAHQEFQRIVWRESPTEPVKDFRLLTVTYGTACAPFLATRVLHQLAEDERHDLSLGEEKAKSDFYVDDLLSGADDPNQVLEIYLQLSELMKRGGMSLRKWASNSSEFLHNVPADLRSNQTVQSMNEDEVVKTLGLKWNTSTDQLFFKVVSPSSISLPLKMTKRVMLSEIAKIFDPLGWLAPIIIRAKILLQSLWKLELDWDQRVPDDILNKWTSFKSNLKSIEEIRIPRWLFPHTQCQMKSKIQLHGFCDASEKAYSAVVYTWIKTNGKSPTVSLISSKTKVAPFKTLSLPRLELCGAVLLSKLVKATQNSLQMDFESIHLWSDSTDVLDWLNSHPSNWHTFIANRVSLIQQDFPSNHWFHVSGIDNPADCASRGLDPSQLNSHPLWWQGPPWFQLDPPLPPNPAWTPSKKGKPPEQKKVLLVHTALYQFEFITSFSSFSKLVRVMSWILRFIKTLREKTTHHRMPTSSFPLSTTELDDARTVILRQVQLTAFSDEVTRLKTSKDLPKKSKLLSLNPFLGKEGLIRVGGRLRNASITSGQRNPIILPRHHHVTKILIRQCHLDNLHAGPQLLLCILQEKYWIIRGRDAIRHVIKRCVKCARHGSQPSFQLMGDLPAYRVTPSRPFSKVGVDYAGPFLLRAIPPRSKITVKGYLALFICFVTKAIHLEVVSSLSSEACIAALRRFVSRRGCPSDIFSDCGFYRSQ